MGRPFARQEDEDEGALMRLHNVSKTQTNHESYTRAGGSANKTKEKIHCRGAR